MHNKEMQANETLLFSICIPIYNTELYLRQCLDSVLNQSFEEYEVIMLDDGSGDNSLKICEEYQNKDARFVSAHQENKGAVAARKAALQLAKGEYVLVLDSDDYLEEGLLERLHKIIAQYNPDVIKLNFARFSGNDCTEYRNKFQNKMFSKNEMVPIYSSLIYDRKLSGIQTGMAYSIWSTVAKRKMLTMYQFPVPDEVRLGDDLAVTAPMIYNASSIYFTDTIDYYYRDTPGSIMSVFKEDTLKRIEVLLNYLNGRVPKQHQNALAVYAVNMVWGYAAAAASKYDKQEFCKLMKTEVTACYQMCVKACKIYKPSVKELIKLFLLKHEFYGIYHQMLMRTKNVKPKY